MKKIMWNHNNPPDYLDAFIQRIEFLCEKRLKENPDYRELIQGKQKLFQKHPIILKLFEGEVSKKDIILSEEEQKAFAELFSIELCRNTYEEWEIYMLAQGDLLAYLNTILK